MAKDNLKNERMKILELLAKGVINTEDAERLLAACGEEKEPTVIDPIIPAKKSQFRMLKVLVDSADGDKVNIQLPIEFAKLLKSSKFNLNLADSDIDIDALIQMVNSGVVGELVNIKSGDGDIVRIVVE